MRIQFVVSNAAFFISHRLPIGLAAIAAGHKVNLIAGRNGNIKLLAADAARFPAAGLEYDAVHFKSCGTAPLTELVGFIGVWRAMRKFKPDLVHLVSPKGILYGGICARLLNVQCLVIAISGMGWLFTGDPRGFRAFLGWAYLRLVKFVYSHRRKHVIVQNSEDRAAVLDAGWAHPREITLIPGSGVDLQVFHPALSEADSLPIVVLPSRMLREKGVVEFVEAAKILAAKGIPVRMVLVGSARGGNPGAVSEREIMTWVERSWVEWWGHRDDMPTVYRSAAIVCLPSFYREGVPKVLLEAAACGRAVVTTDLPGCRDAIIPDVTGLLIPPQDAPALALALERLLGDQSLYRRFGAAARRLAVERFGVESVVKQTLEIYAAL